MNWKTSGIGGEKALTCQFQLNVRQKGGFCQVIDFSKEARNPNLCETLGFLKMANKFKVC